MHHKFMNSVALLTIVSAASASVPLAPTPALARQEAPQGFCRNAAPLPDIGQERNWQAEQDRRDREAARGEYSGDDRMVRGEVVTAPLAVPAPPPPPPPPPPLAGSGSDEEGAIMVTGSRIERRSMDSPSPVTVVSGDARAEPKAEEATSERALPGTVPPRPYPRPQPQSGLLTAGEHDDLLNPELYAAYVRGSNLAQTIRDRHASTR
jgi:hypothetical protein